MNWRRILWHVTEIVRLVWPPKKEKPIVRPPIDSRPDDPADRL